MSTRFKNPLVWLYGLFSALIGGGANGVAAGFAAMGIAPDKFDLNANVGNTVKMVGAVFAIAGVFSVIMYLKQSPLPPIETTDTIRITKDQQKGQQ